MLSEAAALHREEADLVTGDSHSWKITSSKGGHSLPSRGSHADSGGLLAYTPAPIILLAGLLGLCSSGIWTRAICASFYKT